MGNRNRKAKKRDMHFDVTSLAISIIALVISLVALRYDKAEYEYKIAPKFNVTGTLMIGPVLVNGVRKTLPMLQSFEVNVADENNLDRLFIIDPKFRVVEIDVDNISESMEAYFAESIGSEGTPDYVDLENDIYYYYRFLVVEELDRTTDVRVLFFKSMPIDKESKQGRFQLNDLTNVQLIEFEKAHLNDPMYAGERKIAAQYREILSYLNQ